MKTKFMWGGAVLTVFIVIAIWVYRQLRKVMGLVSSALSIKSIEAFGI
jgi:hypothetical protein